jgi:D-sedoheptulose 7-phosphate isomerase
MTAWQSQLEGRLAELANVANDSRAILGDVLQAAGLMRDALQQGGKLLFCGNGGSAADAQHLATEYVVRYVKDRRALAAIALTTDTSLLTAAGNDLGFDQVFARQVEALGRQGDVLVIHSTSGNSPNVAAHRIGVPVVAFTARSGGALRELATVCVRVPTDRTDRAQELHLHLQHTICELIEGALT